MINVCHYSFAFLFQSVCNCCQNNDPVSICCAVVFAKIAQITHVVVMNNDLAFSAVGVTVLIIMIINWVRHGCDSLYAMSSILPSHLLIVYYWSIVACNSYTYSVVCACICNFTVFGAIWPTRVDNDDILIRYWMQAIKHACDDYKTLIDSQQKCCNFPTVSSSYSLTYMYHITNCF